MQVLINAIDKAVRAGVYSLEETSHIINEINKINDLTRQVASEKQAQKAMPVKEQVQSNKKK